MAKDSLSDILGTPELAPAALPSAPEASGGDPAVWTLLGEAGTDPKGQLAVASTYYNRAKKLGRTAQAVVTDPGQGYEAWQDSKARSATQKRYPVGSPEYTAAQGVLNGVMSGQTPALPYTHFYGPKAQADKGRKPPNWATGTGTDIGGNRFYALDDVSSTAPDLGAILDVKGELAANPDVRITPTETTSRPGPVSDPQKKTVQWLSAHGFYDENAAKGSSQYPLAETATSGAPTTKGTWYVARSGELRQVGNDAPDLLPQYQALAQTRTAERSKPMVNRLLTGAKQGAYDVAGSVNRLAPTLGSVNFVNPEAPGPMTPQQSIEASAALDKDYTASRNHFDLVHGTDPAAMVGRGGAQLALTAPTMAVGGELPELGLAGNMLLRGGSEAVQGAGVSALTSATSDIPLGQQMASGAALGPVVGRGTSLIGKGAGMTANALAGIGNEASALAPEFRTVALKAEQQYGIKLRPDQILAAQERGRGLTTGPAAVRDSQLLNAPGSGYGASQSEQLRQLTGKVAESVGLPPGSTFTSANVDKAFGDLGKVFEDIAERNTVTFTPDLTSRLDAVAAHARELGLDTSQLNALDLQVQKIKDAASANGGVLPGRVFRNLTDSNSSLSKIIKNDHTLFGDSAGDIMGVLQDGLAASASPEDVAALTRARFQYKNLQTVLPLASKAGPEGLISPTLLRQRVMTKFGPNYARGNAGPLGDLADIGQVIGDKTPNSGSAARISDSLKTAGLAALGTTELGLMFENPGLGLKLAAGAGLAAGGRYGVNAARGAVANSARRRNKLLGLDPVSVSTPFLSGENMLGRLAGPAYVPITVLGNRLLTAPAAQAE